MDSLPISRSAPFAYTIDSLDSAARSRFLTYLKDLDEAANALAAYLLEHPALLETTDEEGNRKTPPATSWRMRSWIRPARPRPCWRS